MENMINRKNEDREFNKECPFKKTLEEEKITGHLEVDTDRDNESAVTVNEDSTLFLIPGVKHIHLRRNKGLVKDYKDYFFLVYGRCPDEFKALTVTFKDGEDKVRDVKITSKKEKWYIEKYTSDKPNISEITWEYEN